MRDKRLDNRTTPWHELLLIRIGHHLWREWKSKDPAGWPKAPLFSALEAVWEAKEQIRVHLRKEWLEFVENRKKRAQEQIAKMKERP